MAAPNYAGVPMHAPTVPLQRADAWRAELVHIVPKLAGTLGTTGIIALLGIASGAIAARALGPANRGELALLLLWPQLLCTLGNLGVDLAATFLAANPSRRRDLPATLFAMAAVQSTALLALYACLVPLLFDPGARTHAWAMAPLIPSYLLGAYAIAALTGELRYRALNTVRIATPLLYTAAVIALSLAGALSALSAALAFLAAHIAADVLAMRLVAVPDGLGRASRKIAREALSYGVRAHAGRLTPAGLGADTVIVAVVLSTRDLGLFVAATALMMAPRMLAASMTLVVFPQISTAHQAGERRTFDATFALYAGGSLALAVLLIAAAGPVTGLIFGEGFAGAVPVVRLLAVAGALQAVRQFPLEVLRGTGRPGVSTIAEAANWISFLAIVPGSALAWGLMGAAAGSVAASAVALVLGVVIARAGAKEGVL